MAFHDYEITPYDWPFRFFITDPHESIETTQKEFYPDDPTVYPHLVDLESGECSCSDYRFNVAPFKELPDERQDCLHIIIVTRWKSNHPELPKQLPPIIL